MTLCPLGIPFDSNLTQTILAMCGYLPSPREVPGQRAEILSGKDRGSEPSHAPQCGQAFLLHSSLPFSQWVLSL